ncbi:hypothetical protein VII00023_08044 [Vibrio ichthyoenteri ATCC 700023]|uniref:Transposase DDE domain-containing protein n=1 Tax=Vibrio ichthyoenteri ATCC 700023 TaxID=870968 RepID=F9RZX0_9VIBR|nr:hypothetical protein VII00023_08044 [Vibrio ichthyoenteri ATCC 700023]
MTQPCPSDLWIDEEAIAEWKQSKQGKRARPRRFSDLAITTALMLKHVFSMPLRALQGFLDSVFKLTNIPLVCPHYTCISRRSKDVEVSFKTKTRGVILHLAIDATSLNVYGEGEWKVKKHGTDGKRRVWLEQITLNAVSKTDGAGQNVKVINKLIGLGMPVRG